MNGTQVTQFPDVGTLAGGAYFYVAYNGLDYKCTTDEIKAYIGISALVNPMTTLGDVIYGGASGTPTRLGAGTLNFVLSSNGPGTAPSWKAPGSTAWGAITGTLSTQTDLQAALNLKANTSSLGTVAALSYPGNTTTFLRGDGTFVAAGGATAWGSITGTLSSQTDLQTALNLKANTASLGTVAALSGPGGTTTFLRADNTYATPPAGLTNPMTTVGDMIVGGTSGAPTALAAGTSTFVLTANGAGVAPTWQAAGGGGVTGFTTSLNTAGVNATINASVLAASGGSTVQDLVLTQKGTTGAIIFGPAPDGTATGGNKRGSGAVDLQVAGRSSAASVASGVYSFAAGQDNRATSSNSASVGGASNNATGQYSGTFAGDGNTASGVNAVTVGGESLNATGDYSLATNFNCTADTIRSRAAGSFGTTHGVNIIDVFGTGATLGKHQREHYGLNINTTSATPAVASVLAGAASAANQVVLQNNAAMTFSALICAKKSGSADSAHFKIEGAAVRGTSASTIVLVGTPTVTSIGATAGATGATVAVTANTTLGCLTFTVTGLAATTLEWDIQVMAATTVLA